MNLKNGTLNGS